MSGTRNRICLAALIVLCLATDAVADTRQWSVEKAKTWYAQQRWLVGANYLPADAINQLEMWQAETFNPAQINKEKIRLVTALLPQVFEWAREANPSQPITSGVWIRDDWATQEKLTPIERTQLEQSDFITFHVYDWPETLERKILQLQTYRRPIVCTDTSASPVVWHHDVFHADGRPYRQAEVDQIRRLTQK